ncbi:ABC transporter ATP-binding protein [Romeria aff. gracilis LEGE 07310]|uniref:ABC transporter ATP-binding protein n=1 Tax=Vasconcelosia minhoensis LEGE 07310 TaxID=915328 RepID=A0A8J7AY98_9CYAN|nr:ABC transporter ATP-binding protein [Romeria gracilis]MBE9079938.1 ABC transporter ATP-binding protein [Romeria aff. gracilis LEGE 07310]
MTESVAISLRQISKCYRRYTHPVDRLRELLLPERVQAKEFWALRDINLEVFQGETLGIVGQNGSGKSTLLQIVAGTLTPSAGEVHVNGRVSALLELGSGFNPEFTGRQNVFFNGRILGLSQKEIEAKFDTIAAFAEIGDFIEQPVKTYSSGMIMRLAFAVVANTEPSILIVDEALAVGDARFQARCMKRIRQLKEQGTTILFVSHDSSSVKMLCERAVLMNHGCILESGSPKEVTNHYIALLSSDGPEAFLPISEKFMPVIAAGNEDIYENSLDRPRSGGTVTDTMSTNAEPNFESIALGTRDPSCRHGVGIAKISAVKIMNLQGQELIKFETGTAISIEISILANEDILDLVVGISIRNLVGLVLYGTNTFLIHREPLVLTRGQHLIVSFKVPCHLNRGVYTLTVAAHSEEGLSYDWADELLVFEVFNSGKCDGLIDLQAKTESCIEPTTELLRQI